VQLLRLKVAVPCGLLLLVIAATLYPTGYFGPLSARVRSLFVKHTRTGNPLVDSVAEHQPANEQVKETTTRKGPPQLGLGWVSPDWVCVGEEACGRRMQERSGLAVHEGSAVKPAGAAAP
jgi:hypothetical protein